MAGDIRSGGLENGTKLREHKDERKGCLSQVA
jgi:hypothetical protein